MGEESIKTGEEATELERKHQNGRGERVKETRGGRAREEKRVRITAINEKKGRDKTNGNHENMRNKRDPFDSVADMSGMAQDAGSSQPPVWRLPHPGSPVARRRNVPSHRELSHGLVEPLPLPIPTNTSTSPGATTTRHDDAPRLVDPRVSLDESLYGSASIGPSPAFCFSLL